MLKRVIQWCTEPVDINTAAAWGACIVSCTMALVSLCGIGYWAYNRFGGG